MASQLNTKRFKPNMFSKQVLTEAQAFFKQLSLAKRLTCDPCNWGAGTLILEKECMGVWDK